MTAPAPVSIYKHFTGIALESTQGTPVLTPTAYIPVDAKADLEPMVNLIPDTAMRGAPGDQYNLIAGVTKTAVSWGGPMYVDTIGFPLVGICGEVAVSGTNPYTHLIDVLNSGNFQPPTYTVMVHDGMATTKAVPGFLFQELVIKIADGLVTYTTKGEGWTSSDQTTPSKAFSTVLPLPAYLNAVSIGGSSTTDMLDGEITIRRVTNTIHTHGAADVAVNWGGVVSVEGKMTLIAENLTELGRFTTPATTSLVWNVNSSSSADLQFTLSKVQYLQGTKFAHDTARGFVTLPVSFKGLFNTTDVGSSAGYSPLKMTLKNAIAGGVFK